MSGTILQSIGSHLQAVIAAPVELRQADATLVAETTIGALLAGGVKVPEKGEYLASVRLPAGIRLTSPIEIEADGSFLPGALNDLLARSAPLVADALPARATDSWPSLLPSMLDILQKSLPGIGTILGTFTGLQPTTGGLSVPQPMGFGGKEPRLKGWAAQGWVGTPLRTGLASLERAALSITAIPGGLCVETDRVARRSATVQITPPIGEAVIYVLPPGTSVTLAPDSAPVFNVGEPFMNGVLMRRASGEIISAATIDAITAGFVEQCLDRPAAALTAGYTALRTMADKGGRVPALEALEPLAGLSDTIVLRAELAARQGRHADALALFLQSCSLDLPAFTPGLGYLIDRLRFYARTAGSEASRSKLPATGPSDALATLAAVQPFALTSDFTLPFVTYWGQAALDLAIVQRDAPSPALQGEQP